MSETIKVGIVDDHQMVREGLRTFLSYAEDINIIWLANSGLNAVEAVQCDVPDVILMDLVMPGDMDGIRATIEIRQIAPTVKIIALTSFQDTDRILEVLDAGAIGYLQKDVSSTDLLGAIRQAAMGRTILEQTAFEALQARSRGRLMGRSQQPLQSGAVISHDSWDGQGVLEALTSRELEVLQSLAAGLSNKEIAADLGISEKTVKVHVSHILSKLGVYDRTQALLAAAKLGLIQLN